MSELDNTQNPASQGGDTPGTPDTGKGERPDKGGFGNDYLSSLSLNDLSVTGSAKDPANPFPQTDSGHGHPHGKSGGHGGRAGGGGGGGHGAVGDHGSPDPHLHGEPGGAGSGAHGGDQGGAGGGGSAAHGGEGDHGAPPDVSGGGGDGVTVDSRARPGSQDSSDSDDPDPADTTSTDHPPRDGDAETGGTTTADTSDRGTTGRFGDAYLATQVNFAIPADVVAANSPAGGRDIGWLRPPDVQQWATEERAKAMNDRNDRETAEDVRKQEQHEEMLHEMAQNIGRGETLESGAAGATAGAILSNLAEGVKPNAADITALVRSFGTKGGGRPEGMAVTQGPKGSREYGDARLKDPDNGAKWDSQRRSQTRAVERAAAADAKEATGKDVKISGREQKIEQHHHAGVREAKQTGLNPDVAGERDRFTAVHSGKDPVTHGTYGDNADPSKNQRYTHHTVAGKIDHDEQARTAREIGTPRLENSDDGRRGLVDASKAGKERFPATTDFNERAKHRWEPSQPSGPRLNERGEVIGSAAEGATNRYEQGHKP